MTTISVSVNVHVALEQQKAGYTSSIPTTTILFFFFFTHLYITFTSGSCANVNITQGTNAQPHLHQCPGVEYRDPGVSRARRDGSRGQGQT